MATQEKKGFDFEGFLEPNSGLPAKWENLQGSNVCVLGLDQSLAATGWTILANGWFATGGVITPPPASHKGVKVPVAGRLIHLRDGILDLIDTYQPNYVVREAYFAASTGHGANQILAALGVMIDMAVYEHVGLHVGAVANQSWRSLAGIKPAPKGVSAAERRERSKSLSVETAAEILDFDIGYADGTVTDKTVADVSDSAWVAASGTVEFLDALRVK